MNFFVRWGETETATLKAPWTQVAVDSMTKAIAEGKRLCAEAGAKKFQFKAEPVKRAP
jgi:hypothetical protein